MRGEVELGRAAQASEPESLAVRCGQAEFAREQFVSALAGSISNEHPVDRGFIIEHSQYQRRALFAARLEYR